jgi:aminocarboxymuconate-semialdehyde decarboxylase
MTDYRASAGKVFDTEENIVFTGCDVVDATQVHAHPGGQRRQVVVNGRRVKTIDVHAHCGVPEAMALWGAKPQKRTMPVVVHERLREMDEQGVDIEALSINPEWYKFDRDLAHQVVSVQNEKLAELCAAHPERFVAFASVALQFPELAIEELENAVKKFGMRGVAVGSKVAGVDFSDPKFHPFWAKCEELGVLVFIHPMRVPELEKRLMGSGWLENVIGNPLDTTIALSHLIFEGTLDRFPGLKICAAHGGGYLPSYAPRSDAVFNVRPELCTVALKKKPTEYLKQLYYDSLVFTPEMLRHLVAQVGASQICIGTDHPVGWENNPVDHILNTPGLSDSELEAILGGNAAKLLGIKS